MRSKNVLPSTTKKQLYNALVLPHMEFCSVVWQECSREVRQKLERVQNYGMHRCVGVLHGQLEQEDINQQ